MGNAASYFYQGPAGFGQSIERATGGYLSRLTENDRIRQAREDRAMTLSMALEDRARALEEREADYQFGQWLAEIGGLDLAQFPGGRVSSAQAAAAIKLKEAQEGKAAAGELFDVEEEPIVQPPAPTGFLSGFGTPEPPPDWHPPMALPAETGAPQGYLKGVPGVRINRKALNKVAQTQGVDTALNVASKAEESEYRAEDRAEKRADQEYMRGRRPVQEQKEELDVQAKQLALETQRKGLEASDVSLETERLQQEKIRADIDRAKGEYEVFYDRTKITASGLPAATYLDKGKRPADGNLLPAKEALEVFQQKAQNARQASSEAATVKAAGIRASTAAEKDTSTNADKKVRELVSRYGYPIDRAVKEAYGISDEDPAFKLAWNETVRLNNPGDPQFAAEFDKYYQQARALMGGAAAPPGAGAARGVSMPDDVLNNIHSQLLKLPKGKRIRMSDGTTWRLGADNLPEQVR